MCSLAPTAVITELTVTSKQATTSINISWSVANASDADGYVVYHNTHTTLAHTHTHTHTHTHSRTLITAV